MDPLVMPLQCHECNKTLTSDGLVVFLPINYSENQNLHDGDLITKTISTHRPRARCTECEHKRQIANTPPKRSTDYLWFLAIPVVIAYLAFKDNPQFGSIMGLSIVWALFEWWRYPR